MSVSVKKFHKSKNYRIEIENYTYIVGITVCPIDENVPPLKVSPECFIGYHPKLDSSEIVSEILKNKDFTGKVVIKIKFLRAFSSRDSHTIKMNIKNGKCFGMYPTPAMKVRHADKKRNLDIFCDEDGMVSKFGPAFIDWYFNFVYFINYDLSPTINLGQAIQNCKPDFTILMCRENPLFYVSRRHRLMYKRNIPKDNNEFYKVTNIYTPPEEAFMKYFELDLQSA